MHNLSIFCYLFSKPFSLTSGRNQITKNCSARLWFVSAFEYSMLVLCYVKVLYSVQCTLYSARCEQVLNGHLRCNKKTVMNAHKYILFYNAVTVLPISMVHSSPSLESCGAKSSLPTVIRAPSQLALKGTVSWNFWPPFFHDQVYLHMI